MSRNEVLFSGNLGKDPEISYTSGGKALTKFSIAVYQGKGKDDMWMNITCWGELAEAVNDSARKGTFVEVKGRLTQRKYEGKYYYDVVADSVEVILRGKTPGEAKQVAKSDPFSNDLKELDDHPF